VTTLAVAPENHPDPYRTALPHEWTSLFSMKGSAIDLATAYARRTSSSVCRVIARCVGVELFVEAGSFTHG